MVKRILKYARTTVSVILFLTMLAFVGYFFIEMPVTNEDVAVEDTFREEMVEPQYDIMIKCCERIELNQPVLNMENVEYLGIALQLFCKCHQEEENE